MHRDNDSGTTVASLLIDRTNKVFHAAWCGDSRLVHVSEEGKSNWASNDHNPNRVDEAAAIRERGGTIVMGKMYRNGIYEDISRVNSNQQDYQLAVSRAIGDHPWKKKKEGEFDILSAIPEQFTGELESKNSFIIACDGLVRLITSLPKSIIGQNARFCLLIV